MDKDNENVNALHDELQARSFCIHVGFRVKEYHFAFYLTFFWRWFWQRPTTEREPGFLVKSVSLGIVDPAFIYENRAIHRCEDYLIADDSPAVIVFDPPPGSLKH